MISRALAIILVFAVTPSAAGAWGAAGHAIVAELAERRLSKAARLEIAEILGDNRSLASVAAKADTWAREIPDMRPWHYVNVPVDAAGFDASRDCPNAKRTDCLPEALLYAAETWRDPNRSRLARRQALMLLVHLIADAHQPLHCAERNGVRGGLDVMVVYQGREQPLHIWWDVALIERNGFDWGSEVDRLARHPALARPVQPLSNATISALINDCHALARDIAYRLPNDRVLGDVYLKQAAEVADRQLVLAALRLVATLEVGR